MLDMKKKLLFVFNPLSGRAQIKNKLLQIIEIFTKAGYEVTTRQTQCKLDGYNIIKSDAGDYDLIVCCGGDGTLDEAVKAIMERDEKPLLGYIPAGTTNDFGYTLGIPSNMEDTARSIVTGVPFACDIGNFNGQYYSYVAAFGAFVDVSYQTPQPYKNALGHLAYILEGIKRLPTIKSYNIKVFHEDEVVEDEFLVGLITNTVSVGGYRKLDEMGVLLDDGLFEVTMIKKPRNAIEIQSIIASLLKQDFSSPYIYSFRTSKVILEGEEPIEWTLDGEDGGVHKKAEINVCSKAIKILIPDQRVKSIAKK